MSDNKEGSSTKPFVSVKNQVIQHINKFESNLIKIGLLSKSIGSQEDSDSESHDKESSFDETKKRIQIFLTFIVYFLIIIKHSVTILWYLLPRQESEMTWTTRLMSSGNLYTFFGPNVSLIMSGCFASSSLLCASQLLTFIWFERKRMLYSLYDFYPSINASQDRLMLSNENYSFMANTFKYTVKLQGAVNYLVVYPVLIVFMVLLSLSLYQENSLALALLSIPHFIHDMTHMAIGTHHIFSTQCFLFISSTYLLMLLQQLVQNKAVYIENNNELESMYNQLNRINEMVQERNRMVKYLLNSSVVFCSPFMGIMMLCFITDCPVFIQLVFASVVINFVGLSAFAMYYAGRVFHVSRQLHQVMHSVQVSVISKTKVSSRTRLLRLRTNLKLMKLLSCRTKPLGFTFPDGDVVTPLSPFSFIGSTVTLTFMLLDLSLQLIL